MKKLFGMLGFILLVLLFVTLMFYGNIQFAEAQPGGTDFLYRWLPTRLVIFEGYENPYSPEAEYQVELIHHGHAHQEGETPGIFAYPYYMMGIIFPFALVKDFTIARAAWMTFLELANITIIFITLKMINFQPAKLLIAVLILFSLLHADFSQGLIDGNPASISTLFAFLALFGISKKSDGLAGVALAFSTTKPQLVILFVFLILAWAFFRRRWKIMYSFIITMLLLFGISFLLQPSWFIEFLNDVTGYPDIASPSTPQAILSYWMAPAIAKIIGMGLTVFSLLISGYIWIRTFKMGFDGLLWATCITFTILPLTGITSAKSNYIAMLPGIILLMKYISDHNGKADFWASILLLVWIPLGWFFFYAGRNLVINGKLIYFVDFYPLPIVLLILYLFTAPFNNLRIHKKQEVGLA